MKALSSFQRQVPQLANVRVMLVGEQKAENSVPASIGVCESVASSNSRVTRCPPWPSRTDLSPMPTSLALRTHRAPSKTRWSSCAYRLEGHLLQALEPTGFDFTGASAISLGHEVCNPQPKLQRVFLSTMPVRSLQQTPRRSEYGHLLMQRPHTARRKTWGSCNAGMPLC